MHHEMIEMADRERVRNSKHLKAGIPHQMGQKREKFHCFFYFYGTGQILVKRGAKGFECHLAVDKDS